MPPKKALTAALAILGFATVALYFISISENSDDKDGDTITSSIADPENALDSSRNTISKNWAWENFPEKSPEWKSEQEKETDEAQAEQQLEFDVVAIYNALQIIELDENGNVVPDPIALKALQSVFDDNTVVWDSALLNEFQDLVKTGLPGKAGEQTAEVIGNYYQYHQATVQLNSLYEANPEYKNTPEQYEELVALREMYLGQDIATQLFRQQDADAKYMFAALSLESNTEMTLEEKQARHTNLAQQRLGSTSEIPNWESRYAQYQQEKQQILNAGLSDEEQVVQIERLTEEHFTAEERESLGNNNLVSDSQSN